MVQEGHYFAAAGTNGGLLASGGWSCRMPGYDRAAESALADSSRPNVAGVRSVFVDPAAARRGLAWAMMSRIEADAVSHAIRTLCVTATLSGVAFYARRGHRAEGRKALTLSGGLCFPCIAMSKSLPPYFVADLPRHGVAIDRSLRGRRSA